MYVAPRPLIEDDPLFAVRLAASATAALLIVIIIQSKLPTLPPALTVGLIAGMRKSFDAKRAIGGPIAIIIICHVLAAIISIAAPMPAVLLLVTGLFCFVGYYFVLATANPFGMLIILFAAMIALMRMTSPFAMDRLLDGFTESAIIVLVVLPIAYLLFPTRATEMMVEEFRPANQSHLVLRALIRTVVMLGLLLWLHYGLDQQDVILVVAAILVLVFPTPERQLVEARDRAIATLFGCVTAVILLALASISAHFIVVACLFFLGALVLSSGMMHGHHTPMVYQFSVSVMIAIFIGALSTQEPAYAAFTRIVLTIVGAIAAAFLTALLEVLIVPAARGAVPKS